jgi:integrase
METKRFPFTKRKLEALAPPDKQRVYFQDEGSEGLNLCVTAGGARTFYLVKKFQGRTIRVALGKFPTMSVEQARKACRALVAKMSEGIDVQAARQAQRHEQTVQGLWEFWQADAKQRGVRTVGEDERRYARFLGPWAGRRLSAIHKSDVQAVFAKVSVENGIYAANRLLTLVKAMFHKAADMGFTGADPTAGVKKHREEKRDRFLHSDELQGFFRALFAESNATLRDLLLVALLTGARCGNVQAMRWDEIDFATCLWRIPRTKSGKPVVVPLVPAAVEILRQRRESSNGSPWVFSSKKTKTGHITELKRVWQRIVRGANLIDCRPHDLRRSLASYMAIGGTSLPVIGSMLGHTQPSSTSIYARLSTDPIRLAAESATTAMLTAGGASVGAAGMVIDVPSTEGNGHA